MQCALSYIVNLPVQAYIAGCNKPRAKMMEEVAALYTVGMGVIMALLHPKWADLLVELRFKLSGLITSYGTFNKEIGCT